MKVLSAESGFSCTLREKGRALFFFNGCFIKQMMLQINMMHRIPDQRPLK